MEITMTITASIETAAKVVQLLNNVGNTEATPIQQSVPVQPVSVQQFSAPVQPVTPAQSAPIQPAPVQTQYTAPVQPTVPVQSTAPTAAPTYTISQLQSAIAPLLDAGKVPQIQQLVQSFGVNTLMEIPPERYGEFANGLRSLGGVL